MFWALLVPTVMSNGITCEPRRQSRGVVNLEDGKFNNRMVSGMTFDQNETALLGVTDTMLISVLGVMDGEETHTIDVIGVPEAGHWDAIVSRPCFTDSSKSCLLIASTGNGCRGSVRFVELEEPTITSDIAAGTVIKKNGTEYKFEYPNGMRFDAEALVVTPDRQRTFLITNNRKTSYGYVHVFEVLFDGKVTLEERYVFKVGAVRVTDATSTRKYLILRTLDGLILYEWSRLCDADVQASTVKYATPEITDGHGEQESVAYSMELGNFYFVGKGNENIFPLPCAAADDEEVVAVVVDTCASRDDVKPNNSCDIEKRGIGGTMDGGPDDNESSDFGLWIGIGCTLVFVLVAAVLSIYFFQKKKGNDATANVAKPSFLVHHAPQSRDFATPLSLARDRAYRDRERHHVHARNRRNRQNSLLVAPNFH